MSAGEPSPLVFVGGTGRSGTHVVAELLSHHSLLHEVPIETRFHCNPKGLADVVEGRTEPREFVAKLRRYWWHRVRVGGRAFVRARWRARREDAARVRGLHKIVPRERFDDAVSRFERGCREDVVAASRRLFCDLLFPLAEDAGKPGLVEMSCFTIAAAPGLQRIFPEARFVHAVRDGRDSGSSKVAKRQKAHHPSDAASGVEWWQGRLRLAEEGRRRMPDPSRLHAVGLDELVWSDRERALTGLLDFLGLEAEPALRAFFDEHVNAGNAHRERWREGLDDAEQRAVLERYERALAEIEADGYHCAPILRRVYERGRDPFPGG